MQRFILHCNDLQRAVVVEALQMAVNIDLGRPSLLMELYRYHGFPCPLGRSPEPDWKVVDSAIQAVQLNLGRNLPYRNHGSFSHEGLQLLSILSDITHSEVAMIPSPVWFSVFAGQCVTRALRNYARFGAGIVMTIREALAIRCTSQLLAAIETDMQCAHLATGPIVEGQAVRVGQPFLIAADILRVVHEGMPILTSRRPSKLNAKAANRVHKCSFTPASSEALPTLEMVNDDSEPYTAPVVDEF